MSTGLYVDIAAQRYVIEPLRSVTPRPNTYRRNVITLIRVARIALLLVLAVIAVSLIIGMFRPETGGYEKAALAALAAACIGMGVAVTATATYLQRRLAPSRQSPTITARRRRRR